MNKELIVDSVLKIFGNGIFKDFKSSEYGNELRMEFPYGNFDLTLSVQKDLSGRLAFSKSFQIIDSMDFKKITLVSLEDIKEEINRLESTPETTDYMRFSYDTKEFYIDNIKDIEYLEDRFDFLNSTVNIDNLKINKDLTLYEKQTLIMQILNNQSYLLTSKVCQFGDKSFFINNTSAINTIMEFLNNEFKLDKGFVEVFSQSNNIKDTNFDSLPSSMKRKFKNNCSFRITWFYNIDKEEELISLLKHSNILERF